MAKPDPKQGGAVGEAGAREARLAKALRENLRRRKGLKSPSGAPEDEPPRAD